MKNLIDMNPAEIEEMRVATRKRWELDAPPGVWRQHEDAFTPDEDLPEWAKCINGDIEFQRQMGAFKCDDCGMKVGHTELYCPDCKESSIGAFCGLCGRKLS